MDNKLSSNQMIYSIDNLKEIGFSYYKINQLVEKGMLIKLNKQYYENTNYEGDDSDFYYIAAYAPKGVICLMSAAAYYGLTTYRPDSVEIAVHRKTKISTIPEWPKISTHYFSDNRYDLGILRVEKGKNGFQIYDVEKTVADIVSYREKIGIIETKEVLVNYLRRKDRNINQLLRYAKILKCSEIMKTYLEVLV